MFKTIRAFVCNPIKYFICFVIFIGQGCTINPVRTFSVLNQFTLVFFEGDSILVKEISETSEGHSVKTKLYCTGEDVSFPIIYKTGDNFTVSLNSHNNIEEYNYNMPDKLIAFSDIEGYFDGMKDFLVGTGIMNTEYEWTFGNGHLVLVGDFFDRGSYVLESLWLIYKLEQEAIKAGGKLHYVLGNHEAMNIIGAYYPKDFRYVNQKYFDISTEINIDYTKWFTQETELGRWLRTKNSMERIGEYIFVHGGLSPELMASNLSISEINDIVRKGLDVVPDDRNDQEELVLRSNGPLWYRGLIREEINIDTVGQILSHFGSERVVMGHTIVDSISTFFDKKVIGVDLDHKAVNKVYGLLVKDNKIFEIDNNGNVKEL